MFFHFQSKYTKVLNDVDTLTNEEMSIEEKCAHLSLGGENMTSEASHFSNPPQNNVLTHAGNEPNDLNARNSDRIRLLIKNNYLLARVWKDFTSGCTSDYPFLVQKSSNTGEDRINAIPGGHGIEKVISIVDNSAKGKNSINPIDNTINNKNIDFASRIPNPDKGCDE